MTPVKDEKGGRDGERDGRDGERRGDSGGNRMSQGGKGRSAVGRKGGDGIDYGKKGAPEPEEEEYAPLGPPKETLRFRLVDLPG
jgi:hypothetical protein